MICNTSRDPTEYWTDQFLLNLLDTHAISQPTSSTAISNIYCLSRSRIVYVHLDCSFGPIIYVKINFFFCRFLLIWLVSKNKLLFVIPLRPYWPWAALKGLHKNGGEEGQAEDDKPWKQAILNAICKSLCRLDTLRSE